MGGSELGTSRKVPVGHELYAVARTIESHNIDGLLIIGGWAGYDAAYRLFTERTRFPAFNIPMICVPASINNDLPGSEMSLGADTALNSIVEVVDKIKQTAVAARRCFVVEVMGRYCGYLALMSGLATGAERAYIHEEGVTLKDLQDDLTQMLEDFQHGKRLSLVIRNEYANQLYTTSFMCALFEEEGKAGFDVRQAILGHLQQGGSPSPFDRIQATRMTARAVRMLLDEIERGAATGVFIGLIGGHIKTTSIEEFPRLVDLQYHRPKEQWWLELRETARLLSQPPEAEARRK
jgi:6-phosphofructokinase 1